MVPAYANGGNAPGFGKVKRSSEAGFDAGAVSVSQRGLQRPEN